ncbi:MarR family transcriptional regulator [Rhizobium vallis]|uniref:MarR family transcriptional regulator n=1 Tax=Rhizobium vallis TaxID=634290 RepID=A0A3S0Y1I3_9HYPH|nr:MarR family winged helix-turn-helix transcriptional regulator [Rhizobium vallis]RUM20462.1 MarR family transcriptional regulator [Rhizobium vallis]
MTEEILESRKTRISSPVKLGPHDRTVLDLETYVPYFLSSINNALTRKASDTYLEKFGVGIVAWRTMSMLAAEPDIPAARICDFVSLDKAAVSRALTTLNDQGLVESNQASESDPRRRNWRLTSTGYTLHDNILAIAVRREEQLIAGVDPEELEVFLRVIRQMRLNVEKL